MHFAHKTRLFQGYADHNAWENACWFMSPPTVFVAEELIPISQVSPTPVSVAKLQQTIKKTEIEVFIWLRYRIVVNSNVEIV